MQKDFQKPSVGLLLIGTGRFKNMGEDLPKGSYHQRKQVEAQRLCDALSGFAQVHQTGIVYTREDLRAAMDALYHLHVDVVFATFLSWSEDFAWVRFLRDLYPVPVFFAHIIRDQLGFEDSLTDNRFLEFLSAGGLVGALEASGSVQRINRPMLKTAAGTLQAVIKKFEPFARAAKLRATLRNARFGLLPSYNEIMWSTYVDPYALFTQVGPELNFLSVAQLESAMDAIEDAAVDQTVGILLEQYPTGDGLDREKFWHSVRASMGLEALMRQNGIAMMALNDVDPTLLTRIGLRPGFTPCPGTQDVMLTPEGDLGGALACYMLRQLTGKAVNFVEPFHIDHERGLFAAGHAGPNDYTDPDGSVIIDRDVRFAKTGYKYAGAPFAWYVIPPGEKTMLHISQGKDGFKMVCAKVTAVGCPHHLAGYSHGLFKIDGDLPEFFARLMQTGVTQHYGVVPGDCVAALKQTAFLLDMQWVDLTR